MRAPVRGPLRALSVLVGEMVFGRYGIFAIAERLASAIVRLLQLGGR